VEVGVVSSALAQFVSAAEADARAMTVAAWRSESFAEIERSGVVIEVRNRAIQ
jgi:hypothetical protein